jgi:membrane protease YdiL (CAAX protease family)
VLVGFVLLAVRVQLAGSRLDTIDDPARAVTVIVERTMDLEGVLTEATAWERRLYELTVTDGRNELEQAIAWYEEVADAVPGDPDVQTRLAILHGEAGRTDEILETVDRWRARGDVAHADVLAAAYLDAPVDDLPRLRDTAARMVDPGWFRDRLRLRLAERVGDAAGREAIAAGVRARTRPLLWRVRLLTAAEALVLLAGLWGLVSILRRRPVRVAAALVPPPWPLGEGLTVLVRGAAAGVLTLLAVAALGGRRAVSDATLFALSVPVMYLPLLWLARRRLFGPAGVGLARGLGLLPPPGTGRALVRATALLAGAGIALDLALGLLGESAGLSAHWAEWFDEELAFGGPALVAASLLGTVLFAPLFEEIVFRGLLYATLRRRLPWPVAATLSAGVFAVAHGYGPAGFGSVFLSGLLWAIAYERTGSLLPNTAAHVVNNVAAAGGVLLLLR